MTSENLRKSPSNSPTAFRTKMSAISRSDGGTKAMRKPACLLYILIASLLLASCGRNENTHADTPATTTATSTASVNKDDYPIFPDADAGADPSVPAEQGGKGFTGEGWETNK